MCSGKMLPTRKTRQIKALDRFVEFETRLRKWRWFNRRSTSVARTGELDASKRRPTTRPICFTAPIPRRQFDMSTPRRRPGALDPNRPNLNLNDVELDRRYEQIRGNSGVLALNGNLHSKISIDDLKFCAELGSGTCGTVTKRLLDKQAFAVKEMKRTDNFEESKRIFMDLEVIRKCNGCKYIVKCFGFIITKEYLYIAMELMGTCTEKELIKRDYAGFPEAIISKINFSVIEALNYLKEEHSLMHRDVKPSNILLDIHGNCKLCDFGISGKLIDSKAVTRTVGCAAYLAPERIQLPAEYDVRADVWSLGITLVQLARGRNPYLGANKDNTTHFELLLLIRDGAPPTLTADEDFSAEFREFVDACLKKDPAVRPKYNELMRLDFFLNAPHVSVNIGHWLTSHKQSALPPTLSAPPRQA